MFCSECGKQATGKFCWNCGAALHPGAPAGPAAAALPPPAAAISSPPASIASSPDWTHEINYEALLQSPEAKDILARQLPPPHSLTGEEFVEASSKFYTLPVPAVPLMTVTHDLYVHMGIQTGKARQEGFTAPCGRVMLSILCSLVRAGIKVRSAQQASNGCILIGAIPSNLFSFEGDLIITLTRETNGTLVSATTRIAGQLFDWGKSKRCLDQLFRDIAADNPTNTILPL